MKLSRAIKPQGSIELGKKLILEREIKPEIVNDIDEEEIGWDDESSVKPLIELVRNYQLNEPPIPEKVAIKELGLALQYAILGAPGVGKTNLLMHILSQIVKHEYQDSETNFKTLRYGGLILDPKAALRKIITKIFKEHGRENDLVIVSTEDLLKDGGVNIINCELLPEDLAQLLKITAQSSGYGAADPFWFQQMSKVFGAILRLLKFLKLGDGNMSSENKKSLLQSAPSPDLKRLMDYAVGFDKDGTPKLNHLLKIVNQNLYELTDDDRIALDTLRRYASSESREKNTIEQFMEQAFGIFRTSTYARCYSAPIDPNRKSLYAQIIEDGKFVLVSPSPQEIELATILPTLVKLIFQRSVLSRFQQYEKSNNPLLFLADEYHTVATQLQGVPFGDSEFFSQARQFGVLCLIATQSIEQLEASRLGDYWKAVFNTLAAVIFMRSNAPSNQEYLNDVAGKNEYIVYSVGETFGTENFSTDYSPSLQEKTIVPSRILKLLSRGEAIICGTTQGHNAPVSIQYVTVPKVT